VFAAVWCWQIELLMQEGYYDRLSFLCIESLGNLAYLLSVKGHRRLVTVVEKTVKYKNIFKQSE